MAQCAGKMIEVCVRATMRVLTLRLPFMHFPFYHAPSLLQVKGDAFVARVFDNEDEFRRMDFTLQVCQGP